MKHIIKTIAGVPYGKNKTRGNTSAPKVWSQAVIEQTRSLPKVAEACIVRITFLLPSNKFPADLPCGPDLDNLTKRFFDALNETIFSEAQGKDSCVVEVNAMKIRVDSEEESGAMLEVLPIKLK